MKYEKNNKNKLLTLYLILTTLTWPILHSIYVLSRHLSPFCHLHEFLSVSNECVLRLWYHKIILTITAIISTYICVFALLVPPSLEHLQAGFRSKGGGEGREKRKALVSIHVMVPFSAGRWIYLSHFFILCLLTFQVRLQGTVGEIQSRDTRCQMVFRQLLSARTGAQEDAATSLRNAEDNILRQLLDAFRWLLVLPGAGRGSGSRQRLRGLWCAGPGVPPPAGLPVGGPPGCGFVPAICMLVTVTGQHQQPPAAAAAAAVSQDQGAEWQLHALQPAAWAPPQLPSVPSTAP